MMPQRQLLIKRAWPEWHWDMPELPDLRPFSEIFNEDFGTNHDNLFKSLMDLDRRWENLDEKLKGKYQKKWEQFQRFKERNKIVDVWDSKKK